MDFASCLRKSLPIISFLSIKKYWHVFLYFIFAGLFSIVLIACNSANTVQKTKKITDTSIDKKTYLIAESKFKSENPYSENIYNVLLGELYSQFGKPELSAKYYKRLISDSKSSEIIRRATILSASTGQNKDALYASKKWIAISPNSLEALQYNALLLLRNNKIDESIEQIEKIRLFVEDDDSERNTNAVYSKGLKFIGSMLNIESYHDKSLLVYQRYISKYGRENEETQQNLILSSLAMNAEKYDIVLSALGSIEDEDLKHTSKITLMKVKALRESNKIDEAVDILKSFVDKQRPSDSTKLQLVRLLILNNQKKSARPYLKELVSKYPDNKDLLKSLIALEIDQSQLQSAKNNIDKLKETEYYHSDAAYFMGEIAEAEGDIPSALESYQKVTKGSLQKRAKKKIIKLKRLN